MPPGETNSGGWTKNAPARKGGFGRSVLLTDSIPAGGGWNPSKSKKAVGADRLTKV